MMAVVMAAIVAAASLYFVMAGLRSGIMSNGMWSASKARDTQPMEFWGLAALYVGVSVVSAVFIWFEITSGRAGL